VKKVQHHTGDSALRVPFCESLWFIFNASVVHHDDFQQQLGHAGHSRFWIFADSRLWGLVIIGFTWLFRDLK
jgi:hypothetical protein